MIKMVGDALSNKDLPGILCNPTQRRIVDKRSIKRKESLITTITNVVIVLNGDHYTPAGFHLHWRYASEKGFESTMITAIIIATIIIIIRIIWGRVIVIQREERS